MVRWGITARLFAVLFACTALVLVVMMVAQRVGFQRGFLEYLSRQEVARADPLTEGLADYYRLHGHWHELRGEGRQWRRLLWRYHQFSFGSPHHGQPDILALAARLTLLDASRHLVVGNPRPAPDAVLRPIGVDGSTVGWLAISPYTQLTDTVDLQFEAQQNRSLWLGAALAVLLAGLAAAWLARRFLAPIKRVAAASRELGAGNFSTRVSVPGNDELAQLGRDFNRLAAALEDNEKARRAFMADIAHELRTPLTVLQGELEALQDGVRLATPAALQSLLQETATLTKLVEDLRQLAQSDRGSLSYRFAALDLAELTREEARAQQPQFVAAGLSLDFSDVPAKLAYLGDAERLRQLLRNLLANSQRYTDAPGRVEIHLGVTADTVYVRVEDSAPGVPDRAVPHLFERLYRVEESRNRASGGSGLGLAIVEAIVTVHGGEVTAGPSVLGGLSVEVRLPRRGDKKA